jgi:hypothetical protein
MKCFVFQYSSTDSMKVSALTPNLCWVSRLDEVLTATTTAKYLWNVQDFYSKKQCALAQG